MFSLKIIACKQFQNGGRRLECKHDSDTISFLRCISAGGSIFSPAVVWESKVDVLDLNIASHYPDNWPVAASPTGYMNQKLFVDYMRWLMQSSSPTRYEFDAQTCKHML